MIAVSTSSALANLKIIGTFPTGIDAPDTGREILQLARQQAIEGAPPHVNEILVRLADIKLSIPLAETIEHRWGFQDCRLGGNLCPRPRCVPLQDKVI